MRSRPRAATSYGTDSPEVLSKAESLGLNAISGCSIVTLGLSPAQFA